MNGKTDSIPLALATIPILGQAPGVLSLTLQTGGLQAARFALLPLALPCCADHA